ncbi:MAG: UDP-N-acetylmuramoyl-L-alanine--D-glutamate ligase [Rhodothermales bacterium]
MRDVRGRRITVVGAARSGSAAAELLRLHDAVVFVTDAKPIEPTIASRLDIAGVPYEEGGHTDRALQADMFVVSPGVPTSTPIVQKALKAGLPVYSEIEAASWFCRAPIVAVTGSNGKTTTSSLIGHVFRTGGRVAHIGGNIGRPFSAFASAAQPEDVVVLEVSSFQLDHVDTFRPRVAVLLNVTPDHLDRYDQDFDRYARSKFRIGENQQHDDTFIFNQDDAVAAQYAGRLRTRPEAPGLMAFSQQSEVERGAFERDGTIVLRINEEEILMRSEELSLQGRHNLYNSLAAAVAARVMEVRSDAVRESLASFEGVPHRLEFIRQVDGVRYVNDSKATNVNAVWYALESFDEPVILIAGGRDKGNDYEALKPLVRQKARAVIAVGESADKVASELGSETTHSVTADSFADAVRYARLFAEPGDVVLLSPACASFDMFQNYEERGDTFRKLVNEL